MSHSLECPSRECYVSLVAETFGYSLPSEETARKLYPSGWRKHYNLLEAMRWNDLLGDSQKSDLLIDTINRCLSELNPRHQRFLEIRYGLIDGQLRSHLEVRHHRDSGGSRAQLAQLEGRALLKFGNCRSRLASFLPE